MVKKELMKAESSVRKKLRKSGRNFMILKMECGTPGTTPENQMKGLEKSETRSIRAERRQEELKKQPKRRKTD